MEQLIHAGTLLMLSGDSVNSIPQKAGCWFINLDQPSTVIKICQDPSSYWVRFTSSLIGSSRCSLAVRSKARITLAGANGFKSSQAFSSSCSKPRMFEVLAISFVMSCSIKSMGLLGAAVLIWEAGLGIGSSRSSVKSKIEGGILGLFIAFILMAFLLIGFELFN